MRTIDARDIADTVARLCQEANYALGPDMLAAFDRARQTERSPAGREVLGLLEENARVARSERLPYCQDTGFVICFADVGQDVHIAGGLLEDAVNEGVRRGYTEGYLRASIVADPFRRTNTGDNTPAVLHTRLVHGDRLSLMVMAKGGGCENRSRFKMCTPAEGMEGAQAFILDCIRTAGPDACPPVIAGVGIGGTFEQAALLSKRALFRDVGAPNLDPELDALERDVLREANALGIGPQGYGGDTTALAVHVQTYACHIASLPVAVTIECHAHRHREAVL